MKRPIVTLSYYPTSMREMGGHGAKHWARYMDAADRRDNARRMLVYLATRYGYTVAPELGA